MGPRISGDRPRLLSAEPDQRHARSTALCGRAKGDGGGSPRRRDVCCQSLHKRTPLQQWCKRCNVAPSAATLRYFTLCSNGASTATLHYFSHSNNGASTAPLHYFSLSNSGLARTSPARRRLRRRRVARLRAGIRIAVLWRCGRACVERRGAAEGALLVPLLELEHETLDLLDVLDGLGVVHRHADRVAGDAEGVRPDVEPAELLAGLREELVHEVLVLLRGPVADGEHHLHPAPVALVGDEGVAQPGMRLDAWTE
eukprot:gene1009-biopygen8156